MGPESRGAVARLPSGGGGTWGHGRSRSPDDTALYHPDAIEQNGRAALEELPVHPIRSRRLPAEAKAALLEDAALHDPRGIARTLRYTTLNAPVAERVREIRVPTLLVCGERERRFASRRAFAEREIPGLKVVGAEAGHAVNIEAAEVFNRAAVDFIRRLESGHVR